MRLNAKKTVGSFGRQKLICNKIISQNLMGIRAPAPPPPLDPSLAICNLNQSVQKVRPRILSTLKAEGG